MENAGKLRHDTSVDPIVSHIVADIYDKCNMFFEISSYFAKKRDKTSLLDVKVKYLAFPLIFLQMLLK